MNSTQLKSSSLVYYTILIQIRYTKIDILAIYKTRGETHWFRNCIKGWDLC